MTPTGIIHRARTANTVRGILTEKGFAEVVMQLSSSAQPVEPHIYPFTAAWDRKTGGSQRFVLATSPESYLKKAMAKGIGNCFAIGNVFRNEENESPFHRPEFLMAEWYAADTDWIVQMDMTQDIVQEACIRLRSDIVPARSNAWPRISWPDLWKRDLSTDLDDVLSPDAMERFAAKRGYSTQNASWEQLFYQVSLNEIEPHFPREPFFLTGFPSIVSPFARPQACNPSYAERFELILNGTEIANGNTEFFDAGALGSTMEAERVRRSDMGIPAPPVDFDFLDASHLLFGQTWSGTGLGIDRLAMLTGGMTSISDVQDP